MTRTQWTLLAALASAAVTSAGMFWQRQHRLREARWLSNENARLQQEIATRVHDQQTQVRATAADAAPGATARAATQPEGDLVDTDAAPAANEYRNEGNATPRATLQTFAWACDQGDVATVTRLIRFDEAARVRALAFMAAMPPEVRARWSSPEDMAAMLLVDSGMQSPFPVATVLDTAESENISADRVRLHLSGIRRADSEYQLTPEGWKYAITAERVEAYMAQNQRR